MLTSVSSFFFSIMYSQRTCNYAKSARRKWNRKNSGRNCAAISTPLIAGEPKKIPDFFPDHMASGGSERVCVGLKKGTKKSAGHCNQRNSLQCKRFRVLPLNPKKWGRWWESNPRPRMFPKDFLRAQPLTENSRTLSLNRQT